MRSCTICFEDLATLDYYSPGKTSSCKHVTCKNCLRKYLIESLNIWHQKSYETVRCPGYNCSGEITTFNIVDKVLSKEEAERWRKTVAKRTGIIIKVWFDKF